MDLLVKFQSDPRSRAYLITSNPSEAVSQEPSKPLAIREVTDTTLKKDGLLYSPSPAIQEPSVTQLQSVGLFYSPMVQESEANPEMAAAIAEPPPPLSASNVMTKPQSSLQAQHQTVREAIEGNSDFQEQLRKYVPSIKQLMTEQRRDLITLALFSMEYGAIQASDVYNKAPYCRQLFHSLKLEGIRQLFEELEAKGIGEVIGDHPEVYYRAFLRDDRSLSANSNSNDFPNLA